MKTLEEFKQYYNYTMLSDLQELEQKRITVVSRMRIWNIAIWGVLIVLYGMLLYNVPQLCIHGGVIGALIGIGLSSLNRNYHIKTTGYYADFKKRVIGRIINSIGENFTYTPAGCISREEFVDGRIFKDSPYPSGFIGDDLVCGEIGSAKIRFSELKTSYTTGSGKSTKVHIIFKGLFFVITFDRMFKDEIVMTMPSRESNDLHSDFLPATSRESLERFRNKRDIRISFMKNKMYIAISFTEDLFEPKMDKSLLDFMMVSEYFEYLRFALVTAEEMISNSGIWSPSEIERAIKKDQPYAKETVSTYGSEPSPYGSEPSPYGSEPSPYESEQSSYGGSQTYASDPPPAKPSAYDGEILCPSCGASTPGSNRYCLNCGRQLS